MKEEITLAGNRQLKIYGTLQCRSGKRMKIENRVFFVSEKEAITHGYRPCGHCMKGKYQKWKDRTGSISSRSSKRFKKLTLTSETF